MKKGMKQSFLCDMIFQTCNKHTMYSCFFNCSTVRKFQCQLESSHLLKNWHLIISGQAYSPLTLQKYDYRDLCRFLRYPISV